MTKYRQTIIPEVSTAEWTGFSALETRKKVFEYYQNHCVSQKVINLNLGITVEFDRIGARKTSFGWKIYPEKACLVEVLNQLVRYAEYSNWGDRKEKDHVDVIGYLNFKVKVKMDGKMKFVHLVIRLTSKGKFHYT